MNQQKTGEFLKSLRKERNLTQEQLAEKFNVSGRSVSRWETGRNMPELSVLVELAEFYDVDIREIIDGERKSGKMEKELKESLLKVAEYADNEKSELAKRMCIISVLGLCGMIISFILEASDLSGKLPVLSYLYGFGIGMPFAALISMVLYTTGILSKIREDKKCFSCKFKVICGILLVLSFIASIVASVIK